MTLVDDVVGCQRTNVELILESNLVTGVFSQNVKLPCKVRMVEFALFFRVIRVSSVVICEHDEGLQDLGLPAAACGSKNGSVRRHRSPTEDTEAELFCDSFERALLTCEYRTRQEDVSDGVLSEGRESREKRVRCLSKKELVRNAVHSSCSISVSSVGAG